MRVRVDESMALGSAADGGAERDPQTPEVLAVLLENHARFLAFLERRVGSREEAEDILQEAFVRSLDHTSTLPDSASATAWFYRVLRNALTDHYRRHNTRGRALDRFAIEHEVEESAPDAELEAVVWLRDRVGGHAQAGVWHGYPPGRARRAQCPRFC